MTTITVRQPSLISIGAFRIFSIMEDMVETLRTWKERAEKRHELTRLNDRMLQDIGITRIDVYHELQKKVWEA